MSKQTSQFREEYIKERDSQCDGQIIKYRRTLSQHTANYCHLPLKLIFLSPSEPAGASREDAIFANAWLLELVCLTHQYWPWDFQFDSFSSKKRNFLCLRRGERLKNIIIKAPKIFGTSNCSDKPFLWVKCKGNRNIRIKFPLKYTWA